MVLSEFDRCRIVLSTGAIENTKVVKFGPKPKVITPGEGTAAPSDAIVLFDGKTLEAWNGGDKWSIADGVATAKQTGLTSKQKFGDCHFHIEWAAPEKVEGTGKAAATVVSISWASTSANPRLI